MAGRAKPDARGGSAPEAEGGASEDRLARLGRAAELLERDEWTPDLDALAEALVRRFPELFPEPPSGGREDGGGPASGGAADGRRRGRGGRGGGA